MEFVECLIRTDYSNWPCSIEQILTTFILNESQPLYIHLNTSQTTSKRQ